MPGFLRDLRQFFQKFPTSYELVFVLEQGAAGCAKILEEECTVSSANEHFVVLHNKTSLGRARSVMAGLQKASAPFLAVLNIEMATPLADILKLLQPLISEEAIDLCRGHRHLKKNKVFTAAATPRTKLEHVFTGILREKQKSPSADPLCEIWAVRKTAWPRLAEALSSRRVRGWYLTPFLRPAAQDLGMKTLDVAILDSGVSSPSFSVGRIRWQLIWLGFFS